MTSLIQTLNSFLSKDREQWAKKTFWCSSLYSCPRKLYYDRLNIDVSQETFSDPVGIRRVDKGNFVHSMVQNYFKDMGIVISEEEYVKDNELQVSGKIDNIVDINGIPTIVEIKTVDNKDNLHKLPYLPNLWQIQIYMYLKQIYTSKLFYVFLDKSTEKIVLPTKDYNYYSDKDIVEIDIPYNPVIVDMIKTKLYSIINCLETKILPEKDIDDCTYCPYKTQCNSEQSSEYPTTDLASVFEDFLQN